MFILTCRSESAKQLWCLKVYFRLGCHDNHGPGPGVFCRLTCRQRVCRPRCDFRAEAIRCCHRMNQPTRSWPGCCSNRLKRDFVPRGSLTDQFRFRRGHSGRGVGWGLLMGEVPEALPVQGGQRKCMRGVHAMLLPPEYRLEVSVC